MSTLKKRSYGITKGPDRYDLVQSLMRGQLDFSGVDGRHRVNLMITEGQTRQEEAIDSALQLSSKPKGKDTSRRGNYSIYVYITAIGREGDQKGDDHFKIVGVLADPDCFEVSHFVGTYSFSSQSGRLEFK